MKKGCQVDWKAPDNATFLDQAALAVATGAASLRSYPSIPKSTLHRRSLVMKKKVKEESLLMDDEIIEEEASEDDRKPSASTSSKASISSTSTSTTTNYDRQWLQSVIIQRDLRNQGMTRKEVISIIKEVGGCTTKKATNHYNYLVRSGQMDKLGG